MVLGTAGRALLSHEGLGWLLRSPLAGPSSLCELRDQSEHQNERRSMCVLSGKIIHLCLLVFFLSLCMARFSLIAGMCVSSKPARSRAVLLTAVFSHELVDVAVDVT